MNRLNKISLSILLISIIFLYILRIDDYLGINKSIFHSHNKQNYCKFFFKCENRSQKNKKKSFLIDRELYELIQLSDGDKIPDVYGANGFFLEYKDSIYPGFRCSFFKTKPWKKYQIYIDIVYSSDSLLVVQNERRERFEESKIYYDSIIIKHRNP
jgi:hypothetical protein